MANIHASVQPCGSDGEHRIVVSSPFELKDTLKSVLGSYWDKHRRQWTYPIGRVTARSLRRALAGHTITADQSFIDLLDLDSKVNAMMQTESDELDPPPFYVVPPWGHQRRGWHLFNLLNVFLADWDMGTGKSALCVLSAVNKAARFVFIGCPTSVVDVWPEQFATHAPDRFRVLQLSGASVKDRAASLRYEAQRARTPGEKPLVAVCNFEACWRDKLADAILEIEWDIGIADECHRIANHSSKVGKFFGRDLRPRCKRRIALSGTPLRDDPLNAFGTCLFLDPSVFGESYAKFADTYANFGGYGGHEVVGYKNLDDFRERLYSIGTHVKKRDVLADLPPTTSITRTFDLPASVRKIYDALKSSFVADVAGGKINASNALTKLLRLQQLTSGFASIEKEDGTCVEQDIESPKIDAFKDVLTTIDPAEPIVVFTRFVRDVDRVREAARSMHRNTYEMSGAVNELAEWQKSSEPGDVLVANIQSGGVGVSMVRSCYTIYYSLGFSLVDYEQSLARQDRPGQTRPVTYIHLVAKDSVDEIVMRGLKSKANLIKYVTGQLVSDSQPTGQSGSSLFGSGGSPQPTPQPLVGLENW